MDKKKLIERLNEFYAEMGTLVEDHSIATFAKAYERMKDKFGDFVQELEDEVESEKEEEEEEE